MSRAATPPGRPEFAPIARRKVRPEDFEGNGAEPGPLAFDAYLVVRPSRGVRPEVRARLAAENARLQYRRVAQARLDRHLAEAARGAFPVAFEGVDLNWKEAVSAVAFRPDPPLDPAAQAALDPDRTQAGYDLLRPRVDAGRLAFLRAAAGDWDTVRWRGPGWPLLFLRRGAVLGALMHWADMVEGGKRVAHLWNPPPPLPPDAPLPRAPWHRPPWPERAAPLDPDGLPGDVAPAARASWAVAGGVPGAAFVGEATWARGELRFRVTSPTYDGEDFGTGNEGVPWGALAQAFARRTGTPPLLRAARLTRAAVGRGEAPLSWEQALHLAAGVPARVELDPAEAAFPDWEGPHVQTSAGPYTLCLLGGRPSLAGDYRVYPLDEWRARWVRAGGADGVYGLELRRGPLPEHVAPAPLPPLPPEVLAWRPDGRSRLVRVGLFGGNPHYRQRFPFAEARRRAVEDLAHLGPGLLGELGFEWVDRTSHYVVSRAYVEVSADGSLWQHAAALWPERHFGAMVAPLRGGVRPLAAWLDELAAHLGREAKADEVGIARLHGRARAVPVDVGRTAPPWTGAPSPDPGYLPQPAHPPDPAAPGATTVNWFPRRKEGEPRYAVAAVPGAPLVSVWDRDEGRFLGGGAADPDRAAAFVARLNDRDARLVKPKGKYEW